MKDIYIIQPFFLVSNFLGPAVWLEYADVEDATHDQKKAQHNQYPDRNPGH
jgi:hypothetical protein